MSLVQEPARWTVKLKRGPQDGLVFDLQGPPPERIAIPYREHEARDIVAGESDTAAAITSAVTAFGTARYVLTGRHPRLALAEYEHVREVVAS